MLISTVLALSDFFIKNFSNDFWWYPYWYLGNPFNYLIGPVVPLVLLILSKAVPLPLGALYIGVIGISWVIGGIGVVRVVREIGGKGQTAVIAGLLFAALPFSLLFLQVSNGLHLVAFGLLPWVFIVYQRFLVRMQGNIVLFLALSITFVTLIDISILLSLIIGFSALLLVHKKQIGYLSLKTVLILLLSLSLATIWYTPGFWLTILANPSFGGVPLVGIVKTIFQLIVSFLPLFLGATLAHRRMIKLAPVLQFGLLFFFSFAFLTIVRFLFDPDFVMDWIGYILELQFGMAIILASVLVRVKQYFFIIILTIVLLLDCFIVISLAKQFHDQSVYQKHIVSLLEKNADSDERVFLSGSPVFFINQFLPVMQVRGGKDEGSIHPFWTEASYQIREGEGADLAKLWLTALGLRYVLVHQKNSREPFSDFIHTDKFKTFTTTVEEQDDVLYKIENAQLLRIASEEILRATSPTKGDDYEALQAYVATFRQPAKLTFPKPNEFEVLVTAGKKEVILLAVSYSPFWRIAKGEGILRADGLSNMVIIPTKSGKQAFTLLYKPSLFSLFSPLLFAVGVGVLFWKFAAFFAFVKHVLHILAFGMHENEDDY